jgi:D-3-phosphoglycerate dehydrogenase
LVPKKTPSIQTADRYIIEKETIFPLDIEFVECSASGEEIISYAHQVRALYVRGVSISSHVINSLNRCAIIALGSVGTEYVDVEAATQKGIPVTNCPDTFTEEVADHTMMLLLAVHRRVIDLDRLVRNGQWDHGRTKLLQIPRLMGQTLALVGFGRVARAVTRRALPFGLKVIAVDPLILETELTALGVEPVSLEEAISRADILSLHLPESTSTRCIINKHLFSQMKKTSIIVNTGRGSTIEELDLVEALRNGWIAGAGLDVFQQEPISSTNPLLALPNVIMSPHCASASSRFEPARKRRIGIQIALALNGKHPICCVNPEVFQNPAFRNNVAET